MNDPNGLIQFRGTYHAFYQHNPHAPVWGPMHWGHAVSRDLVHWEHLPIALYPDQDYETGCFSGSAVDNDGEFTLLYTAHHDGRSPRETQCLATSRDGIFFTKYEKNPVIAGPPPGYSEEFRDPKVFRRGEDWYLVAGGGREDQGGVLLYQSKDLRRWDLAGPGGLIGPGDPPGPFCESGGDQGIMWECPNLFELDGSWVLLVSPIGMEGARCIFITGEADFERPAFVQKRWRQADYGPNFYAPQVFTDDRGRCILFGWMDKGEKITGKEGWAGAFTFPRELSLKNGEVCQRPVEELALLRKKELFSGPLSLIPGKRNNLPGVGGDSLEIAFTIPGTGGEGKGSLTIHLRASADGQEKTVLRWDFSSGTFTLDRDYGSTGRAETISIPLKDEGGEDIDAQILIDRSSVELFLCGGKYSLTSWIFPRPSSLFYDIFAEGGEISIPDMKVVELE
jgi:beta-fructofuranosidase